VCIYWDLCFSTIPSPWKVRAEGNLRTVVTTNIKFTELGNTTGVWEESDAMRKDKKCIQPKEHRNNYSIYSKMFDEMEG
jgi:hypothetical protein